MGLRKTERKMCDKVHGLQSMKWTEVTGSLVENGQNVARELFRLSQHHIVVGIVGVKSRIWHCKEEKKKSHSKPGGKTYTHTHTLIYIYIEG